MSSWSRESRSSASARMTSNFERWRRSEVSGCRDGAGWSQRSHDRQKFRRPASLAARHARGTDGADPRSRRRADCRRNNERKSRHGSFGVTPLVVPSTIDGRRSQLPKKSRGRLGAPAIEPRASNRSSTIAHQAQPLQIAHPPLGYHWLVPISPWSHDALSSVCSLALPR